MSVTVPAQGRERLQGRDEGCLASHVGSSVGPSRVQGTMAAGEVDSEEQVGADTVEYGRGMVGGTEAGEDVDGKGKGAAEEVGFTSEGVGLRGKGSGPKEYWAESSKGGSLKKGGAQRDCGQIVGREKALAQEGFGVGLSKKGCDPSLGCSKEGGLRGLGQGVAQMGQDDGFMKARAPAFQSLCEELRLIEAIAGAALWTEGGGKTGADEALLEEVSRYSLPENCSLLSFGDRGLLSSSSSFCGEKNEDVMAVRDLVALEGPYVVNEEGRADPLRIIEVDGREREISFDMEENIKESKGGEMTVEVTGRVSEEDNRSVLGSWMNGDFINLCKCLDMPTEGFEGEILLLLRRMEERKNFKGGVARKKRKVQKVSKSERELKKLECSVNFCGTRKSAGLLQIAN